MSSPNLLKPNWEPGLSIQNLPIQHLLNLGIKALVIDVDGTLLPRKELTLHSSVISWIEMAKSKFTVHLLSNNPSRKRIATISKQLNISYTYKAAKPSRSALRKVQETLQINSSEIAIVGDRIFTDVLAGNRLGLYTVLVCPIGTNGKINKKSKTILVEKAIANVLGAFRS